MIKTPEEMYRERGKRLWETVTMKTPDRVPVMLELSYFPAWYTGLPFTAAYYDYDSWLKACIKTAAEYDPDLAFVTSFFPGEALEMLEPHALRWPGHGVPVNNSHQYLELENMLADEYDEFLGDTSDFLLRKFLPRACGATRGLEKLPRMAARGFSFQSAFALAQALTDPEVFEAITRLREIGNVMNSWQEKIQAFNREVDKLGYPTFNPGTAQAPFDSVSDFLRGMHGAMKDMFRRPDKLLEACDMITRERVTNGLPAVQGNGESPPLLFMGLHRGSDGFMSLKQFERFYWPGLKTVLLAVIEAGLVPLIFCEGDWTSRIEYLLELPPGKSVARLDLTDIYKAGPLLKGHTTIMAGPPASVLQTGTPDQVKEFCKEFIDLLGKDGGFIMSPGSSIDKAKPENLKMMVDFTKEYGVYQ
ncbi:MAG: hypothetical protein JW712_01625 [Dehalococcoidales bacterium]|nr:hypothetical protein [Dehalococcoidales bacterium]